MSEQSVELMKRLGFSDGECSIYLTLLSSERAIPIDKLLSDSGMETSVVEETIRKLADRGAVRTVSNALEPVDPNLMLSRLLEEKEKEMQRTLEGSVETASALRRLLVPKYSEAKLGVKPEDIVEPLENLEKMELQTVKIISNAQKETKIFAETFGWYEKVREELFRALDRGVKASVLMLVIDEYTQKRAQELESLGVRVRYCKKGWRAVRGTLVDESELVFLIWATKNNGVQHPAFYRPHYTRNPGLVRIFSDAYRTWWEEARSQNDDLKSPSGTA
jgi:sugar-specific transcriptional regulator TrmB